MAELSEPGGAELLALEQRVRQQGTGLTAAELLGHWRLQQVWPKAGGEPSRGSSALLRFLQASLQIEPGPSAVDSPPLRLCNRVVLGPLELRFVGPGLLRGRRPLLQFWFNTLELTWGDRLLLQRSLPTPDPRRLPFFALLGRGPGGWLAARGRGGGLALWRLQTRG